MSCPIEHLKHLTQDARCRHLNKLRYDRCRFAGICTQCCKTKAAAGKTTCETCLAKRRSRQRERPNQYRKPYPLGRNERNRPRHYDKAPLTVLPTPSRPLGLPPQQVSRLGWCPQNLALSLVWAMKREEAKRA